MPVSRCLPRGVTALAAVTAVALVLGGCEGDRPPLPDSADETGGAAGHAGPVASPEIPGRSEAFNQMELPPGQFVRVLPVGSAYDATSAPVYRNLCLNCHAVSQTSFAVAAWTESAHARAGVTCGACHGTHEDVFVTQPPPERCRTCHAAQVEAFLASGHGPERAPGMGCRSCHEIHATDRRLASQVATCVTCHLDSEHVQGYGASRMGVVFARDGVDENGDINAPDCVYCHMPPDPIMAETGDFRNDRVTLHDPGITVQKHPKDASRLSDEAIEFMVPLCVKCHSERNARYRLENADPLILSWTPIGMAGEVRRKPTPEVDPANSEESPR